MVRDFQAIDRREARAQMLERAGRLPSDASWRASAAARTRWACSTRSCRMPTSSWSASRRRARGSRPTGIRRRSPRGTPGVLHGSLSYLLQDDDGQVHPAHSISAGLDYPGVGPEHSFLKDSGRATYVAVTRRRGAGGLRAAQPAGGDHPGARDRARRRVGRPRSAVGGRPTTPCCSASADVATRTWRR